MLEFLFRQFAVAVVCILAKRPLIDYLFVAGFLEQGRRDPRLGDKPATEVDATDLYHQPIWLRTVDVSSQ